MVWRLAPKVWVLRSEVLDALVLVLVLVLVLGHSLVGEAPDIRLPPGQQPALLVHVQLPLHALDWDTSNTQTQKWR